MNAIPTSLAAYAARLVEATGTTLDDALRALTDDPEALPPSLVAGWEHPATTTTPTTEDA